MKLFNKNIMFLVEEDKASTTKIAQSVGASYEKFRNYLKKSEPPYELLIKIAEYFEISIDDLLTKDLKNSDIIVYTDAYGDTKRKVVEQKYLQNEKPSSVSENDITSYPQSKKEISLDELIDKKIENKLTELLNKYKQ